MQEEAKIAVSNFNFYYGDFHALKNIGMKILPRNITALIGPSGCGKSTLLRCFNRMNDVYEGTRSEGEIIIDGEDVVSPGTDLIDLRRKIGMVFQRPNVFDLSVYENLVFGLKIHRLTHSKTVMDEAVEKSLNDVGLWIDLKDKLQKSAKTLTLEQQQRLCIARVIALRSDVMLLDEPCSTLDPIATAKIEELLLALKDKFTIIIVTHNMQQAARISSFCGFMLLGDLVEFDHTGKLFTSPGDTRTENYITGKFG